MLGDDTRFFISIFLIFFLQKLVLDNSFFYYFLTILEKNNKNIVSANVQYISNKSGGVCLILDGFRFTGSQNPCGTYRWRCSSYKKTKCRATVNQSKATKSLRLGRRFKHNHGRK